MYQNEIKLIRPIILSHLNLVKLKKNHIYELNEYADKSHLSHTGNWSQNMTGPEK